MEPAVFSKAQVLHAVKTAAFDRQAALRGLKGLFSENTPRGMPEGMTWQRAKEFGERGKYLAEGAKSFGRHVGEFGREFIFGSPVTLAEKLRERQQNTGSWAKALGGHAKDFYLPRKQDGEIRALRVGLTALNVGLPALELGNVALRGDPDTRKGDMAHALSGIAAAPVTSRLGIPGMVAQSAIQSGARNLAGRFDRKAPQAAPPKVPYPAPLDHPVVTQAREVAGGPVGRHALNVLKPTPDAT